MDPRGFLKHRRAKAPYRSISERIRDFAEVQLPMAEKDLKVQASRCMNCGVPFCHQGCPLGNPIPEFNDLVHQGRWREAYQELSRTNPFPEFTGKICPAPCEDACVLASGDKAVTIKSVELAIIERAFEEGWVSPPLPSAETGFSVAVVGSGPAGLAAAHQLRSVGHTVTVFERSDRLGGLMRYGVPDYKMDRALIDRRVDLLREAGVEFKTGVEVGRKPSLKKLRHDHDAVLLCIGALAARELDVPGRGLDGVHLAMDYLTAQNKACAGEPLSQEFNASGRNVVILGGGDTGADCYGTAIRQGAASVTQLIHYPAPDEEQVKEWPKSELLKSSFVHDEGGTREWNAQAVAFKGEGRVESVDVYQVWITGRLKVPVPNSVQNIPADLVLLAIGFEGAELAAMGLGLDGGRLTPPRGYETEMPGVFSAGDVRKGASLIVWAIADGLNAAKAVDRSLRGESGLWESYVQPAWTGLTHH